MSSIQEEINALIDRAVDEKLPALLDEKLRELQDAWLSVREAKAYSGLSEWTLRKMAREGKVKKFQPNPGKPPLRISRNSLQNYMSA
jgi:hypothetical protein